MTNKVQVAVIGSGPGGKSAAARAAQNGMTHVLLEAQPHLSNTIYRYQKGKHVMAEPGVLPLRSALPFEAGRREAVLAAWDAGVNELEVNVQYRAEVTGISGTQGAFEIRLANGEIWNSDYVVLGIGVQGNLRKLGVPGEDLEQVQYQLDDPDAYGNEHIIVVGAGDAAIENALALAQAGNTVGIVNRRDEFSRAKDGNNAGILAAISDLSVTAYYNTAPTRVEELGLEHPSGKALRLLLDTAEGEVEVHCDRVIARLGATPPRRFVESCGIVFPSDDPTAVPAVSERYESNVPGLFIVGALAGYPLIKQAMNQGYEVVEYIAGRNLPPADEPLLELALSAIPLGLSVLQTLEYIQAQVPVLAPLTRLQLRELLLESQIHTPRRGQPIFEYNDYTSSFYSIVTGEAEIEVGDSDNKRKIRLGAGQFFGEMGLISGRRRNATVRAASTDLIVIETPRRSMKKLITSVDAVRAVIDQTFILRAVQSQIAPSTPVEELAGLMASCSVQKFKAGEVLFNEGDVGDALYLIRSGSVTISREVGGRLLPVAYVPAGNYVGEMALISDLPRSSTVTAAIACEVVRLEGQAFKDLMATNPNVREQVASVSKDRLLDNSNSEAQTRNGSMIEFLVSQGLGEATDVLLIDESLCVRCDHCEKACADTHGNVSRLNREAGPTFAQLHVPTSCRHCEHPHCMKDCPPDAIRRAPNGEVYISDSCIGCGNCERNCPYGVIQMGTVTEEKPSLITWLLTGAGFAPGNLAKSSAKDAAKKAVKCDMCKDLDGGPACVRACPTGAALRLSPEEFMDVAVDRN